MQQTSFRAITLIMGIPEGEVREKDTEVIAENFPNLKKYVNRKFKKLILQTQSRINLEIHTKTYYNQTAKRQRENLESRRKIIHKGSLIRLLKDFS